MYRVGIIGTGDHAGEHGRACQEVGRTELVAICDLAPTALQRFGERFGVERRYTSVEAMLDAEELDIAIICTWGVSHAAISNTLARSGKVWAILVEKPIASTAAQCAEMIAIARDCGVFLMEGLKYRHHPQHYRVEEIIRSGRIGTPFLIRSSLCADVVGSLPLNNWRYDPARGGGTVYDLACYTICFARYVTAAEPLRVFASGNNHDETGANLTSSIFLEFPGGVTAQLFNSFECHNSQSTEVVGTRGWLKLDLHYDYRSGRELEVVYDNDKQEIHRFGPANQFALQLENVCDCLEKGIEQKVTTAFSQANMRVIDAVFESLQTGRIIDIN